ncbi:MAG: prepilin peptidase [Gemmatimonadota bacterium]|nr:prepilin peptidase [Gemmatimonadota bacterium]MDH5197621.1 prepilin peptidase [Gemmatimonadota bacterium]
MVPEAFVLVAAGGLGAAIGSFLNVCVYRLPRNESLVHPPSACPRCGTPIAWYDNVPVFGWLWLGGKCRSCRAPISAQYPLVEALIAALWVASAWAFGLTWHAAAAAVFGTLLIGITLTDARHYIIPHEFTIGGLVLGLAIAAAQGWSQLIASAIGAGVGFALLISIAWAGEKVFRKEAMGGGDIWMMAMVGAFVGWKGVLLTIFLGALIGTVVFIPLAWLTRHHPHWERTGEVDSGSGMPHVPFGIFLAAGAAAAFLAGDALLAWYWGFVLGG